MKQKEIKGLEKCWCREMGAFPLEVQTTVIGLSKFTVS